MAFTILCEMAHYSLTPPEVSPPIMNLWQSRNIVVIGMPLKTASAENRPQSFSCSNKKELAPTASVQLSLDCKTTEATGYSDMYEIKDRIKTTAKIGRLIGRRIRINVWN